MRVILAQGGNQTTITDGSSAPTRGEVEDYKILVRTAEQVNAELQVFVEPDQFLSTSQQNVSVQLKNAGLDALTSATITWQINQDIPFQNKSRVYIQGPYAWTFFSLCLFPRQAS